MSMRNHDSTGPDLKTPRPPDETAASTTARRRVLIGASLTVIATCVALALTTASGESQSPRAIAPGAAGPAIATVRRTALSSQLHGTGVLQYAAQRDGSPYAVVNQARGVLTALPSPGQVIRQGQVLYRVAGQPVVLLDGSTPAYRTLTRGDTGPDVRQLNTDLVTLRYATRSALDPTSDYFGSETADALKRLQAHLGVNRTGSLKLGAAVFLPSPLRITKVIGTVGTGSSANPNHGSGQPASATVQPRTEFVSLTSSSTPTTPPAPTTNTPAHNQSSGSQKHCAPSKHHKCTPAKPKPTPRHPHKPHRAKPTKPNKPSKPAPGSNHGTGSPPPASGHSPGSGAPAGSHHGQANPGGGGGKPHPAPKHPGGGSGNGQPSAQPILQATSTRREVVVNLDATNLASVRVGDRAAITLPDGQTAPGVVTRIGTVATSSGGGEGGSGSGSSPPTVAIYITLKHPGVAGSIDQAPVQVQITTATIRHALAVPVTALLALGHGQYAIRILQAHRLLRVAVGLLDDASGLVQIKTASVTAGQQILLPASVPT
jgi:Putative peptidoglycan binding domain